MPERPDRDRLLDILEETDVLAGALSGVEFEAFSSDPILQRAVLHALQTIGEAAVHLSGNLTALLPGIAWPQVRGMRNRIVHGYFGVDLMAVWRTAREDAPKLAAAIRASGLAEE